MENNGINGFTFFKSYHEAAKNLCVRDRHALYDAIVDFVFEGKEPSFRFNGPKTAWATIRPHLSSSKRKNTPKKNYVDEFCSKNEAVTHSVTQNSAEIDYTTTNTTHYGTPQDSQFCSKNEAVTGSLTLLELEKEYKREINKEKEISRSLSAFVDRFNEHQTEYHRRRISMNREVYIDIFKNDRYSCEFVHKYGRVILDMYLSIRRGEHVRTNLIELNRMFQSVEQPKQRYSIMDHTLDYLIVREGDFNVSTKPWKIDPNTLTDEPYKLEEELPY